MSRQYGWMLLFSAIIPWVTAAQTVPERMEYCGMELTFTPGARAKIAEYVENMYISPRYFNDMVRRADTYMPLIEEGLRNVRAPLDLRFIAIQESGLRPDAVSTSNAVGFWQFKEPVGREVGLEINELIDERKHPFRASEAAGMYFIKANRDFDNWVYGVIAYFEGPTGAIPYTNPDYYGKTEMLITEETHWYVLKAIAHKLAYEEAIEMRKQPDTWLLPLSTQGQENLKKIYQDYKIDETLFFQYNQWIREQRKLPAGESYTCYIPRSGDSYAGHIPDPNKVPGGGRPGPMLASTAPYEAQPQRPAKEPEPPIVQPRPGDGRPVATEEVVMPLDNVGSVATPKAVEPMRLRREDYADFPLFEDLDYGVEYALYDGNMNLMQMAQKYGKRFAQLLEWNRILPGQEPAPGTMIYLVHPSRTKYHIVRPGENLGYIAAIHYSTIRKVQKKNRTSKSDVMVYIGQKLYLKSKKPKGEKMIVLKEETIQRAKPVTVIENPSTPPVANRPPVTPTNPATNAGTASADQPVEDVKTHWVQHTVKPGETLWAISKQYNTKVEIIKVINKLTSDDLSQGQVLRILAREE